MSLSKEDEMIDLDNRGKVMRRTDWPDLYTLMRGKPDGTFLRVQVNGIDVKVKVHAVR